MLQGGEDDQSMACNSLCILWHCCCLLVLVLFPCCCRMVQWLVQYVALPISSFAGADHAAAAGSMCVQMNRFTQWSVISFMFSGYQVSTQLCGGLTV
jgi:hypothetical protein